MLQDNRHLFGVFGLQVVRYRNTGRTRTKAQVKVVSTAQAILCGTRQRFAYDPAQCGLDHTWVVEKVLGHVGGSFR
jgi:hypothetical protein